MQITELWAIVSQNDDGVEGLCAFYSETQGGHVPMIAADRARLESLLPMAEMLVESHKRPLRLIRLHQRETVQEILPSKGRA